MEEYKSKITDISIQIQQYKDEFAVLTDRIVGNDLEKDDFYFLAALDWAIHLIDGFLWVLENQKTDSAFDKSSKDIPMHSNHCMRL